MPFFACPLSHRDVVRISGTDRLTFLQGLVSNDVTTATEQTGVYAALLTPQGKFLHDLFILAETDALLIDCEAARTDDLIQRLNAYKLRSQITIEILPEITVWAAWEESSFRRTPESSASDSEHIRPTAVFMRNIVGILSRRRATLDSGMRRNDGISPKSFFTDPRLPELGHRLFMEKGTTPTDIIRADFSAYDTHRLALGVADGSRDMEIGKSTLAEGNFDRLNGINWKKGCYVGQELTARIRYRGLAKRRLFPVQIEGTPPPFGTPLTLNDQEAGEMRSSCGTQGLALLKIDSAEQAISQKSPLTSTKAKLWPFQPDWMN